MSKRILITGMGIISAAGSDMDGMLDALKNDRSGVGPVTLLQTLHKDDIPAAEIKISNEELAKLTNVSDPENHTRTSLLAMIAAKEAYENAGIKPGDSFRTALVSATTIGGMDKTEMSYMNYSLGPPHNNFIFTHECGYSTENIADLLGIRGYVSTISTACSSSANAIIHAARLIKHNIADRVIAGGSDALAKFTLNGFNTLFILDKETCKPFDKNRKGLNLGEGAAYIVLESEAAAQGKIPLCELKGYANANDAYHQTASSPEGTGAILAMRNALDMCGLAPADIDYINAHGTGTDNNDLTEGIAIQKIFEGKMPPVSSTKPITGHTLGAAAAVEAVISILSLQNRMIFPNLNFREKIPELSFEPVQDHIRGIELKNILSNSFGFGGNNSTLIFSSC